MQYLQLGLIFHVMFLWDTPWLLFHQFQSMNALRQGRMSSFLINLRTVTTLEFESPCYSGRKLMKEFWKLLKHITAYRSGVSSLLLSLDQPQTGWEGYVLLILHFLNSLRMTDKFSPDWQKVYSSIRRPQPHRVGTENNTKIRALIWNCLLMV